MIIMKANIPILLNGVMIEADTTFSCSEVQAGKLEKAKSATPVTTPEINKQPLDAEKLKSLKKDDLLELASEQGVDNVSEKNTKDEIVEAIILKGRGS